MKKSLLTAVVAIALMTLCLFGGRKALASITLENAAAEKEAMMLALLPGSSSFTKVEYEISEDDPVKEVYEAENGFVITNVVNGYADEIAVMVGVSKEGEVTGLVIRDIHETTGLGGEALRNTEFLLSFIGTKGDAEIGTNIDGLTGATVSSKSVAKAVNTAVAYVTGADTTSQATEWGG